MSDWAWLRAPRDEVIDASHPDYEYWTEEARILEWIESGEESRPTGEQPSTVPARPQRVEVPAVAFSVSREVAAEALGVSLDTFERHVLPDLRVVRRGRRVLVPTRELERW